MSYFEEPDQLAQCEAEVGRLREQLKELENANQDLVDERDVFRRTLDKRDAEIERLRADINYLESQNSKTIHRAATEIERLRVYVSGARCPHCDELRLELGEARSEIERLRDQIEGLEAAMDARTPELCAKDAEIERLNYLHSEQAKTIRELMPENERLRLENEALGAAMSSDGADACGALVVANAEIERLRDQVTQLSNTVDIERSLHDIEIEQLRKALAREEEEHNRCTTFHAVAVKERNFERLLVMKKDAEIERLRGLVYAVPPTEQAAGQTWKEACEANRDEVARLDSMLRPLSHLKTEREEG